MAGFGDTNYGTEGRQPQNNDQWAFGGRGAGGSYDAQNIFHGDAGSAVGQTQRYQAMGRDASIQNDLGGAQGAFRNANLMQKDQNSALQLQRQAAMGGAPSQAQILGQQQLDSGLNQQMAVAAGARGGPLAVASAQRQAQMAAPQLQQQGIQQIQAGRAQEMADARNQYMQGAQGMRQQDLGTAQLQGDQALRQRALNSANQQAYEKMGYDVNAAQLDANLKAKQMGQQDEEFHKQRDYQNEDKWLDTAKGVLGGLAGGLFSDARLKTNIAPLGRLSDMGILPPWMPGGV